MPLAGQFVEGGEDNMCLGRKVVLLGLCAFGLLACVNQKDYSLFRWQLDDAVQRGRAVDHMFLSNAKGFTRENEGDSSFGGKVWRFSNNSMGCEFLYITDSEGRGVQYRFVSAEESCVLKRKFSGW